MASRGESGLAGFVQRCGLKTDMRQCAVEPRRRPKFLKKNDAEKIVAGWSPFEQLNLRPQDDRTAPYPA
jgi:hypothetical protein